VHPSATNQRRPLSPQDGWLSNGRKVLHFRPVRYARYSQVLELSSGELIPGQAPLLKRRKEITREKAIQLWRQKRKERWQHCERRWSPPPEVKPPARHSAASMGTTGPAPCF
jgi:hypothetical protein